jgi:HSP20 family protein
MLAQIAIFAQGPSNVTRRRRRTVTPKLDIHRVKFLDTNHSSPSGRREAEEVTFEMPRNGFSPLRDFMSLREGMDRLFEDRWVSPGNWLTWSSMGTNFLPLDMYETADEIEIRAVVPGVKPDGIDIQFQGGVLTIRAKTVETDLPEGATWLLHEVAPGEYIRQVTLPRPVDADKAETSFDYGVLTLTLPKTADAKPKQIKVGSAAQLGAGPNRT